MACCPKSIIADILKAREDKGGIVNVYYVACGGLTLACIQVNTFCRAKQRK